MPDDVTKIQRALSVAAGERLKITEGRCIALRGRADCRECRTACALLLPFRTPEAILEQRDLEECVACGACSAQCPTQALELGDRRYLQWMRAIAELPPARSATVACSLRADEGAAMQVTCLRGWDPSLVLALWARGFDEVVMLTGECAECVAGSGTVRLEWVEHLAEIGAALPQPRGVGLSAQAASPALSYGEIAGSDRRAFFATIRDRTVEAVASSRAAENLEVPPGEQGAGTESARRHVAVTALLRLLSDGESGDDVPSLSEAAPGSLCTLGPAAGPQACEYCGDCVRFCPVGALRLREKEGEARLSLDARRCVGCGLCVALCKHDALSMRDRGARTFTRTSRVMIHRGTLAVCEKCGSRFGVSSGHIGAQTAAERPALCAVCRKSAERFPGFY